MVKNTLGNLADMEESGRGVMFKSVRFGFFLCCILCLAVSVEGPTSVLCEKLTDRESALELFNSANFWGGIVVGASEIFLILFFKCQL